MNWCNSCKTIASNCIIKASLQLIQLTIIVLQWGDPLDTTVLVYLLRGKLHNLGTRVSLLLDGSQQTSKPGNRSAQQLIVFVQFDLPSFNFAISIFHGKSTVDSFNLGVF